MSVKPGESSYIEVEEHHYKREPAPYPSNCTDQKNLTNEDYLYVNHLACLACNIPILALFGVGVKRWLSG